MTVFHICNRKKNNVELLILFNLILYTTFSIANFQQNCYPKKKTNCTKQNCMVHHEKVY